MFTSIESNIAKDSLGFLNQYNDPKATVVGDKKGKPKAIALNNSMAMQLLASLDPAERAEMIKRFRPG